MALISTLAVLIGGAAALPGQDSGADPAPNSATNSGHKVNVEDTLALMRELAAEPRIPGTRGYDRAVDLIEASIKARGIPVERIEVSATRAIPTRSDVLLFEDSTATSAFAGLRERWSPGAVPTRPLPAAYGFNVEEADVRGPVVDGGRGSANDFERLASLKIKADGAIVLVAVDPAPLYHERIPVLAERAAKAGFAGILIAPMPHQNAAPGAFPPDQLVLEDGEFGNAERLPIPAAPIRITEAMAIRERLRVKRVRGEDGKAVSLKLGPGPVEVEVSIACPSIALPSVPALLAGYAATDKPRVHVPIDQSWCLPLQGAGLAAVAASAARTGDPARLLLLAPRGTLPLQASFHVDNALAARHGLTSGNALTQMPRGLPYRQTKDKTLRAWLDVFTPAQFGDRTRSWASYETSLTAWDRRLGGELSKRTDAATTWIDYLLRSPEFRPVSQIAPGEPILAAPIPVPPPVPPIAPPFVAPFGLRAAPAGTPQPATGNQ